MSMYFITTRDLVLGSKLQILNGQKVPSEVPLHICVRYVKLGYMLKVFDTKEDKDVDHNIDEIEMLAEYKKGKELGGKKGFGIKKVATKYGITQHRATKIIKKAGLL